MLYLLSLLEPSSGDRMALLVLEELLGSLHELVADIALEHARDQVDLQVPLVHGPRLTHKVAEHTFKALREGKGERTRLHVCLCWCVCQTLLSKAAKPENSR